MDGPVDRDPCGCAAGRAMAILGERWTFLILHEAFHGVRRFSEMQRNLGIARNILSVRLQLLVAHGHPREAPLPGRPGALRVPAERHPAARSTPPSWPSRSGASSTSPGTTGRTPCCATAAAMPADPILVCAHCGEELDPRAVTPEPAASVPA